MKLQKELRDIALTWNLELEDNIQHSATGAVIFATQHGVPCVLKLLHHESDEKRSIQALTYYRGYGAVKILQSSDNALLLERALPGTSLKALSLEGKDEEATDIFCDVVRKLHHSQNHPKDFSSISDWGKGFTRYFESGNTQIPKALVEEAKQVFFSLAESQGKQILLHGDLHHDNILFDEKCGWLAIDPKGIIGEAEIEACAFLKNPIGYPEIYANENIIQNRIAAISKNLGLNQERVLHWSFALTVLSAIWLIEMGENPDDWLVLLQKLKGMV